MRIEDHKIKKYLNDFLRYLTDNKKSQNYIKSYMLTVRSFYIELEIELPKISFKIENGKKIITTDNIVGKELILRA